MDTQWELYLNKLKPSTKDDDKNPKPIFISKNLIKLIKE